MTTTSKVLLGTAVVAGAITAAYFFTLDDDQNPIRVKNKQLRIETEDKNANWTKEPNAEKWKLGVGNPTTATEYFVTVYGANPATTCVSPMTGSEVAIQYKLPDGTEQNFTFRLVGIGSSPNKEPELEASTPMTAENHRPKVKKLRRTTENVIGAITSLTVRGGTTTSTCTFPDDRLVAVELCMHNCS